MNWKQVIILICALAISALIVWHDLPINFPGFLVKVLLLFVKLSVVFALAIYAYIFVGGKKKPS